MDELFELALSYKRRRFRNSISKYNIDLIKSQYLQEAIRSVKRVNPATYDTPMLQSIVNENKSRQNRQEISTPNINITNKQAADNIVSNLKKGYSDTIVSTLNTPIQKMHFTMEDYLNSSNIKKYSAGELNSEHYKNAEKLLEKVNSLSELINYNNVLTSGYRNEWHQKKIYNFANDTPMNSPHLSGHAIDIADPNGTLKAQIKNSPEILNKAKELGLYFENFDKTDTWVHIQDILPPSKQTGGWIWSPDDFLKRLKTTNR